MGRRWSASVPSSACSWRTHTPNTARIHAGTGGRSSKEEKTQLAAHHASSRKQDPTHRCAHTHTAQATPQHLQ
eukprot:1869744-Prorocentrum_lima.AAC.1